MFTDYLYQQIFENLITDNSIFSDDRDIAKAIQIIKKQQPVYGDDITDTIARLFFARTLKRLLEDPKSQLSITIGSKKELQESLKSLYLELINRVNKYFGKETIAYMLPGSFVGNLDYILDSLKGEKVGSGTYGTVIKYGSYAVKIIGDPDDEYHDIDNTILGASVIKEIAIEFP